MNNSKVLWVTGLSGSGKTTLSKKISEVLSNKSIPCVYLDGDEIREIFGVTTLSSPNYNREGRVNLAMQYSRLCRMLVKQGFNVVIATISMFHEVYAWNRNNIPGFYLIYLKVPVSELRRRDSKGIYKKYDAGEIVNVAGLDLEVDDPLNPDLLFEYNVDQPLSIEEMTNIVINKLQY